MGRGDRNRASVYLQQVPITNQRPKRGKNKPLNPVTQKAMSSKELVDWRKRAINAGEKLAQLYPPTITSSNNIDGRYQSVDIEKEWIKKLPNSFQFENETVRVVKPEATKAGKKQNRASRHWFDFGLVMADGTFYPYNFKAVSSDSGQGNACSLQTINALISNTMTSDKPLPSIQGHDDVAQQIADRWDKEEDLTARDYFYLCVDKQTGKRRVIPMMCVDSSDLEANPTNGMQINFMKAKINLATPMDRGVNKMIDFLGEWWNKRSSAHQTLNDAIKQKSSAT